MDINWEYFILYKIEDIGKRPFFNYIMQGAP